MISVCIATYNGSRYIKEQVDSILMQLGGRDEIVVCDDQSTDDTLSILEGYGDPRIRVIRNPERLGYVRNFEKALRHARGRYIFLSDQDDIWIPGRAKKMLSIFEERPHVGLVASNFDKIDSQGKFIGHALGLSQLGRSRFLQIIRILLGRAPYFGCTFVLRREFLKDCLPIPPRIESHDIWMALVGNARGKIFNLVEPTLLHRIHGANVTTKKRRALGVIFRSRLVFIHALIGRMFFLVANKERISEDD